MKTLEKEEVAQGIKLHARCSRKVIAAAISAVSGGIGKVSLPILNNVLLEVREDNMLRMVAGDTILTVEKTIPIVSYGHGAVTVDAKTFSDATSSLPEGDIEIELGAGSKLHTRGGKAQFKLLTLPAEEYPRVVIVPDTVHFVVPQRELKIALEQMLFACGGDDGQPYLMGVYFELSPEGLTLASTDTGRMSFRTLPPLHVVSDGNVSVIIPARGLGLVLKNLQGEEGEVKISISNMHARFELPVAEEQGAFAITTQTIQGNFPNYRRVFDLVAEFACAVTVDRLEFLAAAKRAFYIGKDNWFRETLVFKDGKFTLSADASVSGSFSDSVEFESDKDYETHFCLNGRHIIQCLESMPTEKVIMQMKEPIKPVVIKPVFTGDAPAFYDYTHLISAMQIS